MALHPVCRCRCGGRLHGAKRAQGDDQNFFEALPAEDPHHVPDAVERKQRRRMRRADRKRAEAVSLGQERLFQEPA